MNGPLRPAAIVFLLALATASPANATYDEGITRMWAGDYGAAMAEWQADAEKDPRCQYAIGYLYQFGLGVPADIGTARDWYEKAATRNNADALYTLGLLYESAKLGPRNLSEALRYYRLAEAQGPHGDAEYAIGRMILRGRGVPRDPAEGVKWLKLAADHGHPAGQYMLAEAYEAGWGVPHDDSEALYWYSLASRNDQVELHDNDMSFEPKVAIATLKKRMSAKAIRRVEERLRHAPGPSPQPSGKPGAETKAKAKAP